MADYPASVAALSDYNRWTEVSAVWVSKVRTEIGALQTDYASAIGSFSTLASRIAVKRTSTGTWKATGVTHGGFAATTGNHHLETHAGRHDIGASDAIPIASDTTGGYLSSNGFSVLANTATYAARIFMTQYTFVGAGTKFSVPISGTAVFCQHRVVGSAGAIKTNWRWHKGYSRPFSETDGFIEEVGDVNEIQALPNRLRFSGPANALDVTYRGYILSK